MATAHKQETIRSMEKEIDLLISVCETLEATGISYMLTGSFASNFYSVPRMTRDMDIVIQISDIDIDKLFLAFNKNFYIDKEGIREALNHQGIFNIIHNETIFKVDFIIRKNSIYRKIEFQRRAKVKLKNKELWIVSPEDLIISKLDWAKDSYSDIQLRDVKNLLTRENLDRDYIQKWVRNLDLLEVYKKVQ